MTTPPPTPDPVPQPVDAASHPVEPAAPSVDPAAETAETSVKAEAPAAESVDAPTPATAETPALSMGETQEFVETFSLEKTSADINITPVTAAPPPAPKPAPPKPAAVKLSELGDFRLAAMLGQGAMGTVYRARQVSTNRMVALKVVSKELALQPGFIQRFRRETRILGRLNHPNIVRYLAAGESHGFIYLAMELVDGGSLSSWIGKIGQMTVGDTLHIARACAEALQYAHGMNLVHRDIKPDNLLLTKQGQVKLADLGLARTTDDSDLSCTRTGTGVGTPLYIPPEQARDAKRVDARSDWYALGGVLYHCLTGKPPFQLANLIEMIMAKESGKFPRPSQLNPKVPATVDRVISKLLEREPNLRYQTGAELIKDLDKLNRADEKLSFMTPEA